MNTKGITLKPEFEKAILDLGFSEFTEIQEKCIPIILEGKDVIGLSHTGSGKTAAFGFPALERVTPGKGLQLLVIVPTRELCNQVAKEFIKFTKYRRTSIVEVYGGVAIKPQMDNLRYADVVVSTPGRLLDHITRRTINMDLIKIVVLDEADKMFEMGFIEDIQKIMATIPRNSQKLLFSATMPPEILKLVHRYMNNPEKVKMQTYIDKSKIIQHYYDVDRREKYSLLVHVLKKESHGLTLVFCATRHIVDLISRNLNAQNVRAEALHGGMSQNKRKQVMDAFKSGDLQVLVASDVAARGIDVKDIQLVVNYDIPKTSHEYIHRIGRTARAGSEGKVISLLTHEDYNNFRNVLEDRSLLIHKMDLPQFESLPFLRMPRSSGRSFERGRPQQGNRRFSRGGSHEGSRGGGRGGGHGRDQRRPQRRY